MQFNPLGRTGLLVSRLALGAMTFGEGGPTAMRRIDATTSTRLVDEALNAGINFFDTAATYGAGRSEEILGQAIGTRRDDVVIATKVAGRTGKAVVHTGLSRRHIIDALDGSLRRLGTDYVDVYLAHHFDPDTPLEETLETFDHVVRQGKVRYLGFSNWPAWAAATAIGMQLRNGWHTFKAAECYYSLVGRELEHEILPLCEDAGVGVLVWSPLAMGFLSGKYTREDMDAEGGRFSTYDNVPPFDLEHGHDVMDAVRSIAADHGVSPAQVSMAWLLAKKPVTSILVGATSLSQLQDNVGATDVDLTPDDLKLLDTLTEPAPSYPGWVQRGMANRQAAVAAGGSGR